MLRCIKHAAFRVALRQEQAAWWVAEDMERGWRQASGVASP